MARSVTFQVWSKVVEFLYLGLPNLAECESDREKQRLAAAILPVAGQLEFPELVQICENVQQGEDWLNPSIGTWLGDRTGQQLKEMFFAGWAPEGHLPGAALGLSAVPPDVEFVVEAGGRQTVLPAHRLILASRCPLLEFVLDRHGDMGGDAAHEAAELAAIQAVERQLQIRIERIDSDDGEERGKVGRGGLRCYLAAGMLPDAFSAFLQYLYTDHAPIEGQQDQMCLLALANRFGVKRLVNLCELYISKSIERATFEGIKKAAIDIIGLLLQAQENEAIQLAAFCLQFISTNYGPMKMRPEWDQLKEENLRYVEEHKWPPQSYLDEVKDYEDWLKKNKPSKSGGIFSLLKF